MRIHGVRLIAVRMSPSRRCQTSWRARPTTADADVGIEGTNDALAETRHASATNISSRLFVWYVSEFQLRGEFLTSVRGPRSAERSSEEVRVRGGLGPRSEVRARSELGPSAEVMASVRATRSPRSEDQAKKLETAGRRSMKGAPSPHSPLVRFTARIHSHASMPQTIAHHSEHSFRIG